MRAFSMFFLVGAGLCLLAAPSEGDAQPAAKKAAKQHVVKMGGTTNVFTPKDLEIKVGEEVKWDNIGGTHTATSDDIKTGNPKTTFNTGTMNKGQQAIITFNTPGTYRYHCEFHGPMTGTITVKR